MRFPPPEQIEMVMGASDIEFFLTQQTIDYIFSQRRLRESLSSAVNGWDDDEDASDRGLVRGLEKYGTLRPLKSTQ